jgi:hypothetical protein
MVAYTPYYHPGAIRGYYCTEQRQRYCSIYLHPLLMLKVTKYKELEANLVIAIALVVIFLLNGSYTFLYVAVGVGVAGALIKPLGSIVARLWYSLAELLGGVVSKIILSLVFFVFLLPLAFIFRMVKKDPLQLKKPVQGSWKIRDHLYCDKDLEETW